MNCIAIVDDSKDSRELFEMILRDHHEFRGFEDGVAFLEEFQPGDFELILLDLAMPELDGFAVFDRIRELDKEVPVVAITALASSEERERAHAAGFCDYFVKPILE